jgi:DNA polymerase-1
MAKLLLLDGNSLAYRAFFALPTDMATASGQVTNAVFGFTSMLINLLKDHRPDSIAVAFDRPEPTFRHELFADYKAGRVAAPDILRQQMGLVRQVVETLQIPIVEIAGFEADDVIATLATQAEAAGDEVIVVTGDRDAYQLVHDPLVKVLYNRRGVSDYVLYDEAGIKERTGVTPDLYPQYAALRGDPSDNLPGVPGVGEKTAAKLINDYGDLDGVFANVDKATPKLRENLVAHEVQVRKNAECTPLIRDLDLDVPPGDLRMGAYDTDAVRELFAFLEFRTLYDRLLEAMGALPDGAAAPATTDVLDVDVTVARDATAASEALATLNNGSGPVAVAGAWSGVEGRSELAGVALATGDDTALWVERALLSENSVLAALQGLLGEGGRPLEAHRSKELLRGLTALGVDVAPPAIDTAIAAYLVEPGETDYVLEDLAARHLGLEVRSPDAAPAGQLDLDGRDDAVPTEAARRAVAVARLAPTLDGALDARGLRRLYDEIELPLIPVLARMEQVGVRVDVAYLRELSTSLTEEVRRLEVEIQELAGEPFKVNSTPQLRQILFEKLALQPQKKTKTGFSTDAASLEKLRGQHPIIDKLLRYREVEKLRSTYGENLLAYVADDGRIHATFNQTVARTGRLSSEDPNLHNIPVRREEGRRFRRAFIPADGCELLIADYDQIELRVIAHLAEDPGLVEAFRSGQDIHSTTASRLFGVEPADVTHDQRSKAKMVSYGLAYGMEAYGLGQRLGIATEDAAEILGAYFDAFPNVKSYMARTVAEARDRGYTETLFGRRRQIPELSSSNFRLRQAGERQAMNAGIQGLAADIFKVALIRIDTGIRERNLASRLILQVHDEVILEVPPDERDVMAELTLAAMCGAAELSVPLKVNVAWGANWDDAKG